MATIIGAAGGGNWTTGATWVGGVAPTAADDARLDATSGSITINSGAVCRSMNATGYTAVLTHTAGVTLTIGDGTAGAGGIAFYVDTTSTYTLGNSTTSALNFISTAAGTQLIAGISRPMGDITINGAGSYYQIYTNHTCNGTVALLAGTLDTNDYACTWGAFASTGSATRVFDPSTSAITISGAGTPWNVNTTGLTVTANTAVVTLSGASVVFSTAGTVNYNGMDVIFTGGGSCTVGSGGITLADLTYTGTAVKTNSLNFSGNATMTGTLTITGNSAVNRVLCASTGPGTAIIITAAVVSLSNVDFRDIDAAGAAIPFTGTSLGNCLGNTDITFDAPATQTHTASAGGNWSDVTKWTSRVPLPQDDVIVNSSTTGTLTADMPRLGADVLFTGFAGTASFSSVANDVYGALTLGSGMTVSGTMGLTLRARGSEVLTSAGKQFTQAVTITAPSGTYTLADAFSTAGAFTHTIGTFTGAGYAVTCLTYNLSGSSSTVNQGNGTWTLTGTSGTVWTKTTGTLNANSTGIVISVASASSRTFAGGGATYFTLSYTVPASTGGLVLTCANTFAAIYFSDTANARTLTFPASTTTTFTSAFNVSGTPGKLMSIVSSSPGTQHTLSKASGTVSVDYLSISDSNATGGDTWLAGANSLDN